MIALAKLSDTDFCPQIEKIIQITDNPRLRIMGAEALGIYGSPNSMFNLIDMLRVTDPPMYLRDGIVLAMSAILETQHRFYPILVRFVADPSLFSVLATDEAETAYEFFRSNSGKKKDISTLAKQAQNFQPSVLSLVLNNDGRPLSRWILELPSFEFSKYPAFEIAKTIFSETLLDDEMNTYKHLHLLIVHWTACQLKILVRNQ